jgi:pimeloyl-ACP methyl ester carboxylesterase
MPTICSVRVSGVRLMAAMAVVAGAVVLRPATAQDAGDARLQRRDVAFTVTNLQELGGERQVAGFRVDPPCDASTVVFLQHGLSYTGEAWDFPGYSYARTLAAAGYSVVAIDRPGYGRSPLDSGYTVSTEVYAHAAAQIVEQLRDEFEHVVVGGHSAGAEVTELTAGLFGGVDAVIGMGYTHFPSPEIYSDFLTGDIPRALADDYEYFLGTPEHRAEMFFTADADPAVVAADTAAAVLTPSGEILTIGNQPSQSVTALIDVPVYLQLAEFDRLFPVESAELEAARFLGAPSVTVDRVAAAGHTYMLHPTGRAAADRLAAWLRTLPGAPFCTPDDADPVSNEVGGVAVDRPAPPPAPSTDPSVARGALAATGGEGPVLGLALLGFALVARATGRSHSTPA